MEEWKVCLVGPESSGKSSICQRLLNDSFFDEDDPTLEDRFTHGLEVDSVACSLQLLDTGGSSQTEHLRRDWYANQDAFLVVFSLADSRGLVGAKSFLAGIKKHRSQFHALLVGSKSDAEKAAVSREDASALAYKFDISYHEVTSVSGSSVRDLFHDLVKELRHGRTALALERTAKEKRDKAGKKSKRDKKEKQKGKPAASLEAPNDAPTRHRSGLSRVMGARSKSRKDGPHSEEGDDEDDFYITPDSAVRQKLISDVPLLRVKPLRFKTELTNISGPLYPPGRARAQEMLAREAEAKKEVDTATKPVSVRDIDPEHEESLHPPVQTFRDVVACRGVSTYPLTITESGERMGDPICDQYGLTLFNNRCLATLADGCNWGPNVAAAARLATDTVIEHEKRHQRDVSTLRDAVSIMLRGFKLAHERIIEGRTEETLFQAGTTTMISAMVFELDDIESDRWGVVALSVGDCKMLRWSSKTGEVSDLTSGNRSNLNDARDPGGRIGPYSQTGGPDLRNLASYWSALDEGDYLILCSDGIHDNLDPQQCGKSPAEIGISGFETWDDIDFVGAANAGGSDNNGRDDARAVEAILADKQREDARTVREGWVRDRMNELFQSGELDADNNRLLPEPLCSLLIRHAQNLTEKSRLFMQEFPDKPLPKDYSAFPGKMDHTTLCVCRIGRVATDRGAPATSLPVSSALDNSESTGVKRSMSAPDFDDEDFGDWEIRRDEETGELFFFNSVSGETSWADPRSAHESGWAKYYDDDDEPFYHNRNTGETSWETPPLLRRKAF